MTAAIVLVREYAEGKQIAANFWLKRNERE